MLERISIRSGTRRLFNVVEAFSNFDVGANGVRNKCNCQIDVVPAFRGAIELDTQLFHPGCKRGHVSNFKTNMIDGAALCWNRSFATCGEYIYAAQTFTASTSNCTPTSNGWTLTTSWVHCASAV